MLDFACGGFMSHPCYYPELHAFMDVDEHIVVLPITVVIERDVLAIYAEPFSRLSPCPANLTVSEGRSIPVKVKSYE